MPSKQKNTTQEYKYTFTLTSEQTKEALKAIELLMRLKINQPHEISKAVLDSMYERIGIQEFCDRKDKADKYIDQAFNVIFPTWDEVQKDNEWYRLYNIYQVIRFAIHETEYPNSIGVDSYSPIQFTEEPLPEWKGENVYR